MLQIKKLAIYPSSRSVREKIQDSLKSDKILPKVITIGEFEKKALFVEDRIFIDQEIRVLLLNRAAKFSNFKELHIEREFFSFLKNSKFLFNFFDELSVELIEIDELQKYDIYLDYQEHLEILKKLLYNYKKLLDNYSYVDKINLPSLYKINSSFIRSYSEIELHLEGYLSSFELKLFSQIAEITTLKIYISTNEFNKKMVDKFKSLNLELKTGYNYIINLSNRSIVSKKRGHSFSAQIETKALKSRVLQVAYVKKRLYDYYKLGIKAEKIAVILPDSSFCELLDLFDKENNLNFAMGFPYKKSTLYQKLLAKYDYYNEQNYQNIYRLKRLNIDIEKLTEEQKSWNKKVDRDKLYDIFLSIIDTSSEDEAVKIYIEELYIFSKLFKRVESYPFYKLLHLLLTRLATKSIDDVRGGKITVLELLESRGVMFDGVIIVDFNEGVVPKSSNKDLFLSSELRSYASLPTVQDRENLQKYYYKRVFDKAKYISICYVEDEQNQPSRFLDELNIKSIDKPSAPLDSILFKNSNISFHHKCDELTLEYDFTKIKLSATALKTFFDCRRSYYLKYIKKIEEANIPKDDDTQKVIGILLHQALKIAYDKQSAYFDEAELRFQLQSYLYKESEKSQNLRLLVDIWLYRLKEFIANEIKRAKDGYTVLYKERTFDAKIDNFTLTGIIDRVDKRDDYIEVIDYKSGKIPKENYKQIQNTTNFQLQFYYLISSKIAQVSGSYFYDLNQAKLISEEFFDEKLDILYQKLGILNEKYYDFTMTNDLKKCIYCPYQKICNRIL